MGYVDACVIIQMCTPCKLVHKHALTCRTFSCGMQNMPASPNCFSARSRRQTSARLSIRAFRGSFGGIRPGISRYLIRQLSEIDRAPASAGAQILARNGSGLTSPLTRGARSILFLELGYFPRLLVRRVFRICWHEFANWSNLRKFDLF